MLFASLALWAQTDVTIGDGNVTTNGVVPIAANKKFSMSQTIYLASEIDQEASSITKIKYYYNGSTALPNAQDLTIYIANTTLSEFTDNTEWVPVEDMTQVYTGGIDVTDGIGWAEITFTTPYSYDGSSNIIVCVDENYNDNDAVDDDSKFVATTYSPTRRSLCFRSSNDENPDPNEMSGEGFATYFLPNTILSFMPSSGDYGCLEASYGQFPEETYQPVCLGNQSVISDAMYAGQYSVVQLSNETHYTFESDLDTDYLTVSNSDGTEVLAYGTGIATYMATADEEVRVYVHSDAECGEEAVERTLYITCGEGYVPTAPEGFTCYQGDGLNSNDFEAYKAVTTNATYLVADDFTVDSDWFDVSQIRMNLVSESDISTVAFNFYSDNNGPDAVVETLAATTPTLVTPIAYLDGKYYYDVTIDLATELSFETGTYWIQPTVTATDETADVYWEMTSTGSNGAVVQMGLTETTWVDNTDDYQAVFFIAGDCYNEFSQCAQEYDGTIINGLLTDGQIIADDFEVTNADYFSIETLTIDLIAASGQPTGLSYLKLFTNNIDVPGEELMSMTNLNPDDTELIGTFNSTYNVYRLTFTFDDPIEVTDNGTYWFEFEAELSSLDTNVYIAVHYQGTYDTSNGLVRSTNDGDSWSYPTSSMIDANYSITCTESDLGVDIPEAFEFSYYPNPVKEQLHIASEKTIQQVTIYNLQGQIVQKVVINNVNAAIQVQNLPSNVYFVEVELDGGVLKSFKILKD